VFANLAVIELALGGWRVRSGVRIGLTAGGSRIRTIGSAWHDQGFRTSSCRLCRIPLKRKYGANENRHRGDAGRLPGDRWFESISLQRRVCKLSVPVALSGITSRGRHTARKIEHMPVEMPTSTQSPIYCRKETPSAMAAIAII
jgi:hypothetical protein